MLLFLKTQLIQKLKVIDLECAFDILLVNILYILNLSIFKLFVYVIRDILVIFLK